METGDPKITAAACRYLLVALLPRLELAHPGLISGVRAGIAADREAMASAGKLSPEVDATVSQALRILSLVGTG